MRGCVAIVALFFVVLIPTSAQNPNGMISGIVSDTSGGLVPGATVIITDANTNVRAWAGATNGEGAFLAPALPAGVYNIAIASPGFRASEILALNLQVNQRARVDAILRPGDLKETVTVVGENVAVLNKEDSTVGFDVSPSQVRDLPLANRDIFNLLNLSAGVSAGGDATAINSAQYSINGSRTQASEWTVDGMSMMGGTTGSTKYMPSTEAIRQVKILASTYSAEYGRTSGATIAAVIDSGTNQYHGGVYEYFRNEDLDANNFFNNIRGQRRPYDRQNQFGAKLGGPIFLPFLYHGKERTFFFVNYQGTRQLVPTTNISTLPDVQFRGGDFSSSPVAVADPLSSAHAPFPGNRIPANRLDPAALKVLSVLPPPNSPGTFDPSTGRRVNNYVNQVSPQNAIEDITTRVDHNISSRSRLFARFTHEWALYPMAAVVSGLMNPGQGDRWNSDYQGVVGLTQVLAPTLILEVRANAWRDTLKLAAPSMLANIQDVLAIQRTPTISGFSGFSATSAVPPLIAATGFTTVGSGSGSSAWQFQADNVAQQSTSLSWVRSGHTLKIGAQYRWHEYNVFAAVGQFAGSYSFTGEISAPNTTAGSPINALADVLLGQVKTANYALSQPMSGRHGYNLAFYLQDDWKLTPRLTINLGLRDDHEAPMMSTNGIFSMIDPSTGRLLVARKNASDSLNLSPPSVNLGPRVGFAYALNPKTVIRSAFGIFFYQLFANIGNSVTYPGFTLTQQYNSIGRGIPQAFSLSQGMPLTLAPVNDPFLAEKNASATNPLSPGLQYADCSHLPENMEWNFGIQREVARGTALDISYVGSHAYHLPLVIRQNALPSFQIAELITATGSNVQAQLYRPFPTVSAFNATSLVGSSAYHSLQLRATRQVSRSVSFTMNYTFAKAMDDGSGTFVNTQPVGVIDSGQLPQIARKLEHAPSAFDRKNSLVVAPRYTVNSGPKWFRDISITGVFTARSGLPLTISQSNLYPDAIEQRPDINGRGSLLYAPMRNAVGTGVQYLRPTSDPQFPLSPTGPLFATVNGANKMILPASIGNLGRMVLRAPGDVNLNLSVGKRFPIRERLSFQVRGEAYNAFNHANLLFPATSLSVVANTATQTAVFNSPGYGLITSARSARFMQLVARIEF
jgi:hypothetical protein